VTTVTFNNPTLGQLLSWFNPSGRDFLGQYYCFTCSTILHYARFHFMPNGQWQFFDDGQYKASGTATLVEWSPRSLCVKFRLEPGGEVVNYWHPWGTFAYENGPPSWRNIEYVAQ
jgi:hypothetical protein